jgi:hypothetical protein
LEIRITRGGKVQWRNFKGRDQFEDLVVDGRILK